MSAVDFGVQTVFFFFAVPEVGPSADVFDTVPFSVPVASERSGLVFVQRLLQVPILDLMAVMLFCLLVPCLDSFKL